LNLETPNHPARQNNGARTVFLALCWAGLVRGVSEAGIVQAGNGERALQMAVLVRSEPRLTRGQVWRRVAPGVTPNEQADVVFALHEAGLLLEGGA